MQLFKRFFFAALVATAFLVLMPMAVNASSASIITFNMDRTTVQSGQSILMVVQTNNTTTHVFAYVGGVRTQGVQGSAAGGIITWVISLQPAVGSADVRIFANTNNSTAGAANLTIPITVTSGQTLPPATTVPATAPPTTAPAGGNVQHAPLAIVSITEIPALAPNQIRLEIVTGTGANNVWVRTATSNINPNTNQRIFYRQATRVSHTANTITWHVNLTNLQPMQQTVQVSANTAFVVSGATNANFALQHSEPFVAAATPFIFPNTITANPPQVATGGNSVITIITNADVNYVWTTVNGMRVDAVRANPTAPANAFRNWTLTVAPATTSLITVFANTTNTTTGAISEGITVNVSATPVQINSAVAIWYPGNATVNNATEVRILVETNLYATDVWLNVGGRRLDFDRGISTVSGNTRIWALVAHRGAEFTSTAPITVNASDLTNPFGAWHTVSGTIPGVGQVFIHDTATQTGPNQGAIINYNFNRTHIHRDRLWDLVGTFTTADDITEIRVRDAAGNSVGLATSHFTVGANNTRIWTIGSMFPIVPTGANSMDLIVQIRRGSGSWADTPAITLPVF